MAFVAWVWWYMRQHLRYLRFLYYKSNKSKGTWKDQGYAQSVGGTDTVHHSDVIMGAMASQITSLTVVYSPVYSGADQRKHQSSASLAFVRGIHRWPVNSPHKWPVTRKMFPFDDVIVGWQNAQSFVCKVFRWCEPLKLLMGNFMYVVNA